MTTSIGPVATSMPLAAPDERRRMTIPPLDGVPKPVFEDLHIIDMMSLQGSPDDNPLHRFGHVEPGAGTRRVQEPNAVFPTPLHQIATVMSCQIIQNEQHAQGRVHAIQLLRCRKRVPILPPSPFWDLFWRGWTRLENGGKFLPHLHSTRVNPLAPPGRRLVQSPFFFLRIGIFTLVDRPIFPFLERSASMAPRAIFLPAVARLMQRIEDRKGAHLGQPIAGLTQCAL